MLDRTCALSAEWRQVCDRLQTCVEKQFCEIDCRTEMDSTCQGAGGLRQR